MITEYYPQASDAARAILNTFLADVNSQPEQEFSIALSGGATPALLFNIWASEYKDKTPWKRLHVYWVDERCVGPDDPESNYGMAKRLLLDKVPIPSNNIHRIIGENEPHEEALQYSGLVQANLRLNDGIPEFDYVFLGIGSDGHTSSVFPGQTSLLFSPEPYAVSVNPHSGQYRIALTGQPMLKAIHTWFFATGQDKAYILRQLIDEGTAEIYPAGYVLQHARNACLYTDVELK